MKLNLNPVTRTEPMTPEQLEADLLRRRSNAARPRPARKRRRQTSRADSKRAAIRES